MILLDKKTHNAFTLAEVLITLTIIGVIAAMTIPNLMNKYSEHETVVAVKTAHSILSDAVKQATIEYGEPGTWTGGEEDSYEDAEIIAKMILPYMKTSKICKSAKSCFYDKSYKTLNGNTNEYTNLYSLTNWYNFILANGTSVGIWGAGLGNYDDRAHIRIDINNTQPPNQFGKDTFQFAIKNNGSVLPHTLNASEFLEHCNNTSDTHTQNGVGCTGWVIYKGNMDYLHCTGLTWASKSCKEK